MFPHSKSALNPHQNPQGPSKKHLLSSQSFLITSFNSLLRSHAQILNGHQLDSNHVLDGELSLMSIRVLSTAERLTRTYLTSCRKNVGLQRYRPIYDLANTIVILTNNLLFIWCLLDISSKKSCDGANFELSNEL